MQAPTLDLSQLSPGFRDPGHGAQEVFRHCLHAMAHPGKPVTLKQDASIPLPMMPAAGAIALALLDQDTSVWLSPGLAVSPVTDYLRFHTGCHMASNPAGADFALIHSPDELPELGVFSQGNDEFPEQSTTVVLQVPALGGAPGDQPMWTLTGPGIREPRSLSIANVIDGTGDGIDRFAGVFAQHWQQNHQRFPCGIDLFFASGHQLCGLPRSTRLSV